MEFLINSGLHFFPLHRARWIFFPVKKPCQNGGHKPLKWANRDTHTSSLWCIYSRSIAARKHWIHEHALDVKENSVHERHITRLHARKSSLAAPVNDSPQSPVYGDPHNGTDPHMPGMQIERHQLSCKQALISACLPQKQN